MVVAPILVVRKRWRSNRRTAAVRGEFFAIPTAKCEDGGGTKCEKCGDGGKASPEGAKTSRFDQSWRCIAIYGRRITSVEKVDGLRRVDGQCYWRLLGVLDRDGVEMLA